MKKGPQVEEWREAPVKSPLDFLKPWERDQWRPSDDVYTPSCMDTHLGLLYISEQSMVKVLSDLRTTMPSSTPYALGGVGLLWFTWDQGGRYTRVGVGQETTAERRLIRRVRRRGYNGEHIGAVNGEIGMPTASGYGAVCE